MKTPQEYLQKWAREASYEVLPTKKALDIISAIPGRSSIRVTCRPTGIEETVKFAESVDKERVQKLIPHIAARRITDSRHFENVFGRMTDAGIKNIFVVGGDGKPSGRYEMAADILSEIKDRGIKFDRIGVAGYPDGNPVYDQDETKVLLKKQEIAEKLGTEMEIVTQMCFDQETLFKWIKVIRREGVYLPVVAGILGQVKLSALLGTLKVLGITDVMAFLKSKPKLAGSLAGGTLGGIGPGNLLKDIAENNDTDSGIEGISIFTLGSITKSVEAIENLLVRRIN